jgi:hypothetical protein
MAHPYGDERAFENWKLARNKALRELDMDFARAAMPGARNDEVRLMAMHKARYECTEIEAHYRHESRAWLAARGLSRQTGEPLLPEGDLP